MMKRLLAAICLLLVLALAGCAGSSSSPYDSAPASDSARYDYDEWDDYGEYDYGEYESGEATPEEGDEDELSMTDSLGSTTTAAVDSSKMVYRVKMHLQTTSFDQGPRTVLDAVDEMGGYVETAYLEGRSIGDDSRMRHATYTLRIPSANLPAFLQMMEGSFNILQMQQEAENVTNRYYSTETRLGILKEREERLLAMIEDSDDMDDILRLDRELASIRMEMESYSSSMRTMSNNVIFSTVTLRLSEVFVYEEIEYVEPSFSTRLSRTASNSWNGFVSFCQGLLLFIIAVLPAVVVLGILGGIGYLIYKIVRKRVDKKDLKKPETSTPPIPRLPQPPQAPNRNPEDPDKPST